MSITKRQRQAAVRNECQVKLDEIGAKLEADYEVAKQEGDKTLAGFDEVITDARRAITNTAEKYGLTLKESFYELFDDKMEAVQKAKRRMKDREYAASLHDDVKENLTAPPTLQRLLKAENLLSRLSEAPYKTYVKEVGLDLKAHKTQVECTLKERLGLLWVTLDKAAVKELRPLISDRWESGPSHYYVHPDVVETRKRFAQLDFELNEDGESKWNDAVARHLKGNLYVGDFIGLKPGLASDLVLRMAAEADIDKDLTKAQIVLAYCNQFKWDREAVGWLRQRLALMVVRMQRS